MYNVKYKAYPDGTIEEYFYSEPVGRYVPPLSVSENIIEPFFGSCVPVSRMDTGEEYQDKKRRSISNSRNRTIQKVYDIARCNNWNWFVTMTFNPQLVDSFNFDECSIKLSNWLKNLRRVDPSIRYLFVPEQHKSGAWHFHGVVSDSSEFRMTDSGHKDKRGRVIYNIGRYKYGFTTATLVGSNEGVTKYITKYITKDLVVNTPGKKRYWSSRNIELPQVDTYLVEKPEQERLMHENKKAGFTESSYDIPHGVKDGKIIKHIGTLDCVEIPNEDLSSFESIELRFKFYNIDMVSGSYVCKSFLDVLEGEGYDVKSCIQ